MISSLTEIWIGTGLDFGILKRINLAIIVVAVVLLAVRNLVIDQAVSRRWFYITLGILSAVSVINYSNYFSFHGERTFLHLHDLSHYYLGSKYHAELGYDNLYVGMLRAEAELFDNHFTALEVRDLATNNVVHIAELLQLSDPVKENFDPRRWSDFKKDVDLFHSKLGPHWATVLKDHGYNPTPVWTVIGSFIANRVPAGSLRGIYLLSLLDPILVLFAFVAIYRTFDLETAAWGLIYFCVIFGATFGWTGGAFLRQLWFFALISGLCALARRRHGLAGGLLALAASLRLFPLFFTIPLVIKMIRETLEERRLPRRFVRLWTGYLMIGGLALIATVSLPQGLDSWRAFRDRIEVQLQTISPNVVGLTEVLTFDSDAELVTAEEFQYLREQRGSVSRAQLVTVLPVVLLAVTLLVAKGSDFEVTALGVPLILVSLNLAGYYFTFLLLLALVKRNSPGCLAALFAAESVPYVLLLFDHREAALYAAWSLALMVLMLVLFWQPLLNSLRGIDAWTRAHLQTRVGQNVSSR